MTLRSTLSVLCCSTVLMACGDEETVDPAELEALQLELAALQLEHAGDIATLQNDLITLQQEHDEDIVALEAEIAAITGGLDLTALADAVDDHDERLASIEADYALASDLASVHDRVSTVEADYLLASDISELASESYVDSAVAGIDLSAYATQAWVGSQGYSTDAVDATLVDLLDYLSVDTATDSVVFDGANVHIQSGAGSTNATVNGLGNLFVGYNEDSGAGFDRTGSHNLIVGRYHSFGSWGGLLAGQQNTLSGEATVAFGSLNEASGYFATITGGYFSDSSGDASSVLGGHSVTASGDYSTVSGGYDNEASGDYSSVSGGAACDASGNNSSVSGGHSTAATGTADWAAGALWEDD